MQKYILIVISLIFLNSLPIYSQEQEVKQYKNTTGPLTGPLTSPPDPVTVIVSTFITGVVLEVVGVTLGIEANHLFLKAAKTKNLINAGNSSLQSQYAKEEEKYNTMQYASWGLMGSGAVVLTSSIIYTIIQLAKKPKPNPPPDNTVFKKTSFSRIPIAPNLDVFLDIDTNVISIGAQY